MRNIERGGGVESRHAANSAARLEIATRIVENGLRNPLAPSAEEPE